MKYLLYLETGRAAVNFGTFDTKEEALQEATKVRNSLGNDGLTMKANIYELEENPRETVPA